MPITPPAPDAPDAPDAADAPDAPDAARMPARATARAKVRAPVRAPVPPTMTPPSILVIKDVADREDRSDSPEFVIVEPAVVSTAAWNGQIVKGIDRPVKRPGSDADEPPAKR